MSDALAVLTQTGKVEMSEADLIFQDGLNFDDAYEFIPTQLTVAPGGVTAFATADGDMVNAPLVGVVIGAVIARGLWREGNKVPLCSSIGGDWGMVNLGATPDDYAALARFPAVHPVLPLLDSGDDIPERFSCRGCPMAEFGSALKGTGKACKEKRRLLLLPDGWSAPVIMNLPTMSVKNWDAYCSTLRTKLRKPFYGVKTRFSITKQENGQGQPFGMVTMALADHITDPAFARAVIDVQRQFANILRDVPMEDATYAAQTGAVNGANGANGYDVAEEDAPF